MSYHWFIPWGQIPAWGVIMRDNGTSLVIRNA